MARRDNAFGELAVTTELNIDNPKALFLAGIRDQRSAAGVALEHR